MKQYLITYDLNRPGQSYNELYLEIKRLGNWYHILQNAWVVKTNYSSMNIAEALKEHVDANDKIFVTEVSDWACYNMSKVTDWLKL